MRVLITGGAGFIGSAVARRFIAEGIDDVLVFEALAKLQLRTEAYAQLLHGDEHPEVEAFEREQVRDERRA